MDVHPCDGCKNGCYGNGSCRIYQDWEQEQYLKELLQKIKNHRG